MKVDHNIFTYYVIIVLLIVNSNKLLSILKSDLTYDPTEYMFVIPISN